MVVNYRESYDLFACSGILFNHESEYRGAEFVTQKIIKKAVSISKGDKEPLILGNIDAKRDWGYAKDYVEGMYLMLQADSPDDYVLATNKTTSIREFATIAFEKLGINIKWDGAGVLEKGINIDNGEVIVKISEEYYRPAEVELLIGDYSKALKKLNWAPKVNLEKLIEIMIKHCNRKK